MEWDIKRLTDMIAEKVDFSDFEKSIQNVQEFIKLVLPGGGKKVASPSPIKRWNTSVEKKSEKKSEKEAEEVEPQSAKL